jgi:hypothetical protein
LFLPALLITGPFLSDLVVTILAIIFLFKKKNFSYLNNIFMKFLFLFWAICVISSTVSNLTWYSLETSLPYIRFIIFSIMVTLVARSNFDFKIKFGSFLFITMLILIIDSYIQLFSGKNIIGLVRDDPKRLSSFFGDEYVLGSYLLKMSPLLIWSFFEDQKKTNFIVFFFLTLIVPIIFFSGQRVSLIMSFFLILGIIIFLKKNLFLYFSLAICFLVIGLNLSFNKNYNERIINDIRSNIKYENKFITKKNEIKVIPYSILSPSHTSLYFTGIEMLKTNYFLGHGPKSFRVLCQKFQLNKLGCSTHPHNFYIQALAEIGLLGFFTLLIGFIYFVCKLFSKLKDLFLKKKITANIFLIIAVLIILFPFQPNGNLFGNWISIPTFLTIGLYLYDIKILSKKKEVSST